MDRETHMISRSPWLLTNQRMSMSRERATLITHDQVCAGAYAYAHGIADADSNSHFHQRQRPNDTPCRRVATGPDMPAAGVRMVGVYF
jgi:hypothetical protein